MSNFPSYREFTYTIEAGGAVDLNRHGSAFGCLDATSDFYVKFDGQPRTSFQKGLSFELPEELNPTTGRRVQETFSQIRIENRSDAEITVTVFVGDGRLRDSRLTLPGSFSAYQAAASEVQHGLVTVGPGERVEVINSDSNRLSAHISHLGGSGVVFLGGSDVLIDQGLPLSPGHTHQARLRSSLYAYNQSASTVKLAILEYSK